MAGTTSSIGPIQSTVSAATYLARPRRRGDRGQVAWEDMGYSAERRVMAEWMDSDPTARLPRLLDELLTEPAATNASA